MRIQPRCPRPPTGKPSTTPPPAHPFFPTDPLVQDPAAPRPSGHSAAFPLTDPKRAGPKPCKEAVPVFISPPAPETPFDAPRARRPPSAFRLVTDPAFASFRGAAASVKRYIDPAPEAVHSYFSRT